MSRQMRSRQSSTTMYIFGQCNASLMFTIIVLVEKQMQE
jgi:hypothetical protein